jgi:hypothetical protein
MFSRQGKASLGTTRLGVGKAKWPPLAVALSGIILFRLPAVASIHPFASNQPPEHKVFSQTVPLAPNCSSGVLKTNVLPASGGVFQTPLRARAG